VQVPDQTVPSCVIPAEKQSKELPAGPPRHWIRDILSKKGQQRLRKGPTSMPGDKIRRKEIAFSRGPSEARVERMG